jgi:hypothetical protein
MSDASWQNLRSELNGLNQSASRGLRRRRYASAFLLAARRLVWIPAQILGLWLVVQVLARLLQNEMLQTGWLPWLSAALVVYLLRMLAYAQRSRAFAIRRDQAIGEWDAQLHLHDRLLAADDFLHQASRSPFMEAAVADAAEAIKRTRQAHLQFDSPAQPPSHLASPVLAAALLLMTGTLVGRWQAIQPETAEQLEVYLPTGSAEAEMPTENNSKAQDRPETPSLREQLVPSTDRPAVSETQAYATDVEEKSKESEGKTGNGRSAAAESSTGAGNSQGTPSQQGQISKPGKEKTKAKKKKASQQKPHEKAKQPPKNDEQESGSTAGRGSSRGSNRNPASSDWSSKDHVNTPDDDQLTEEEETDDEEEEQEARGGMQPSLRDRRPPVSRELQIGFGNQPNPDANGRGGPSQPKKSRGTASLVLGVPIPDRVKGQPNPGKTKITQERVQPKAESPVPVNAESRFARTTPGSALQRQPLAPWMRSLVRDYFLALRNQVHKP